MGAAGPEDVEISRAGRPARDKRCRSALEASGLVHRTHEFVFRPAALQIGSSPRATARPPGDSRSEACRRSAARQQAGIASKAQSATARHAAGLFACRCSPCRTGYERVVSGAVPLGGSIGCSQAGFDTGSDRSHPGSGRSAADHGRPAAAAGLVLPQLKWRSRRHSEDQGAVSPVQSQTGSPCSLLCSPTPSSIRAATRQPVKS